MKHNGRWSVGKWGTLSRRMSHATLAGLLFLAVFVLVGRVWRIHLHIPLDYSSDAFEVLVHLVHNYVSNDVTERLFAPFNAPHASPWQYLVNGIFQFNGNLIALCRWLTGDDAAALNLYFLLTFPMTFGTAYYACRRLRLENPYGFCVATLYALMPYHLWRGEIHILESTYLLTPLYVLVLLRLWSARPLFWRHDGLKWQTHLADRDAVGPLILLLFFGSFHYYHQFFFAVLAASIALGASAYRRNWRHAVSGIALAIIAMVPLILKDTLTGWIADPILKLSVTGYPIAGPGENEYYPLKLVQLILPIQHHRWAVLAHLRDVYDSTRPLVNENSSISLGLIGAIGFAVVLGFGLLPGRRSMSVLAKFGWISLVVLLVASMGGLSAVMALASQYVFGYGFPLSQARGWNRIVIYLGFFAYLAFFWVLRAGIGKLGSRWSERSVPIVSVLTCGLVLIFALWDQVPGPLQQTDVTQSSFRADHEYFAGMESQFPPGASVFQLPVVVHHTSGWLNGRYYTEALRPFIHTKAMRFSFGADYGSAQIDLLHHIDGLPTERKLVALCEYGFSTILIDRGMYVSPDDVEVPLAAALNQPSVRSPDGTFAYLPLTPYCHNHRIRPIEVRADADHRMLSAVMSRGVHYDATDFQRKIGHVVDNGDMTQVTAGPGEAGFLAFGPYRSLPIGSYEAIFNITTAGGGEDALGTVDVNGTTAGVSTVLAAQEIPVNSRAQKTIRLTFSSTSRSQIFEFRVYVYGKGSVSLNGVDILPLGKASERQVR